MNPEELDRIKAIESQALEVKEILNQEWLNQERVNESARKQGLPVISTSVEATQGASIQNFKDFQLAAVQSILDLVPADKVGTVEHARLVQSHIRRFQFEAWVSNVKTMALYSHLNELSEKLTKEARAELKLTDIAYNPGQLAAPAGLKKTSSAKPDDGLTAQERDLKKIFPDKSIVEIRSIIRNAIGAAYQKGLTSAGTPVAIDTCSECGADYPASQKHDCPKAKKEETLREKMDRIRREREAKS